MSFAALRFSSMMPSAMSPTSIESTPVEATSDRVTYVGDVDATMTAPSIVESSDAEVNILSVDPLSHQLSNYEKFSSKNTSIAPIPQRSRQQPDAGSLPNATDEPPPQKNPTPRQENLLENELPVVSKNNNNRKERPPKTEPVVPAFSSPACNGTPRTTPPSHPMPHEMPPSTVDSMKEEQGTVLEEMLEEPIVPVQTAQEPSVMESPVVAVPENVEPSPDSSVKVKPSQEKDVHLSSPVVNVEHVAEVAPKTLPTNKAVPTNKTVNKPPISNKAISKAWTANKDEWKPLATDWTQAVQKQPKAKTLTTSKTSSTNDKTSSSTNDQTSSSPPIWNGTAVVVLASDDSVRLIPTRTWLGAAGLAYTLVDTKDAAARHLQQLAPRFAQYPLVYRVQDGQLSYWGDYGQLQAAHQQLDLQKPLPTCNVVALVSGQRHSQQERALTILKAVGPVQVVHGVQDAAWRQELHKMAGRVAYPLFFVRHDNRWQYWGDYDQLEVANDGGNLAKALSEPPMVETTEVAVPAPKTVATPKTTNGWNTVATKHAVTAPTVSRSITTTNTTETTDKRKKKRKAKKHVATASKEGGAPATPAPSASKSSSSTPAAASASTSDATPTNESASGTKNAMATSNKSTATTRASPPSRVDITVYGATSFVARHVLTYLIQAYSHSNTLWVTLAGRNPAKLDALVQEYSEKVENLRILNDGSKIVFDSFVAESSDLAQLELMTKRTKVVLSCAGPYARLGSNVVAACVSQGADYVDITGEVDWASEMRQMYGPQNTKARIISFCGFDSVPSDLAVYAAVKAMKTQLKSKAKKVQQATTFFSVMGVANGGTLQTMVEMPLNLVSNMFRWVPFLMNDPLALVHPKDRAAKSLQSTRNRMAMAEWVNQLPASHSIFRLGFTAPFLMSPINTKVVNASAIAHNYGPNFVHYERYLPAGFKFTVQLGTLSLIPALIVQFFTLLLALFLKIPILGQFLVNTFLPAGSGSSDILCKTGYAEVYVEVVSEPDATGNIDKANCFISFQGDPGNWITAQTVVESALALALNKKDLPPRSEDGFGTPSQLLGDVLLKRLTSTKVRPIEMVTDVRQKASSWEWFMRPVSVQTDAH